VIILPVGLAAIAVGELLLPLLLASQRPELLEVARLFMLTIVVVMLYDLLFGMLLGDHGALSARTTTFPVQRAALPQPAGSGAHLHRALAARSVQREDRRRLRGLERGSRDRRVPARVPKTWAAWPSRALARTTVWYGIRTQVIGFGNTLISRCPACVRR
jgi:hypothetical protein